MSKSQRLSEAEIRQGFRLLGETCELADDPSAWRANLLDGLHRLVGSYKGHAGEELVAPRQADSRVLGYVMGGMEARDLVRFGEFNKEGGFHIHPLFPVVQPIAHLPWTRVRRALVDDLVYYADRVVNDYQQPSDMDDSIHSRQPIPRPGWSSLVTVFRDWRGRPFCDRERKLVHLVHEEMGRLWHRPAAPDPAAALPRRLRQLVQCFRTGMAEKQVAARLGLSGQTVHAYVKDLYRRVGASGRFEMLALMAPPRPKFRPRLTFEVLRELGDAAGGADVVPPWGRGPQAAFAAGDDE
jgi:DNA-binding CsgD family transcriptional regulator